MITRLRPLHSNNHDLPLAPTTTTTTIYIDYRTSASRAAITRAAPKLKKVIVVLLV